MQWHFFMDFPPNKVQNFTKIDLPRKVFHVKNTFETMKMTG